MTQSTRLKFSSHKSNGYFNHEELATPATIVNFEHLGTNGKKVQQGNILKIKLKLLLNLVDTFSK